MPKLLDIKNLSLILPHKTCFENFNATVLDGAKIALAGDNGTGKTSILKAIMGLPSPVDGDIILLSGARAAYVPQTVLQHNQLSGGERFNKALSAALAQKPDILLLDEPTNHLDAKNRAALLKMIDNFTGAIIVVSHDAQLLRQINAIWHIREGRIETFSGNYDDYIAQINLKRAALEGHANELQKQKRAMHQKLMAEQQRAAKSNKHGELAAKKGKWAPIVAGGKKRAAQKTAGGKKSAIFERTDDISRQITALGLREEIKPTFNLPAGFAAGSALFIMDGAAGYDGKIILSGVNLSLAGGARAAVTGANAAGKSTLFKAILNTQNRLGGTWETPKPHDIGYLDQHYNNLSPDSTALQLSAWLAPSLSHAQIRKHLNDFLFRKNEEVNEKVSTLSGGERARLSLALLALKVPKLLLLDEVTNNIDLTTRAHVEQVLSVYPGALLLISHDEDFIKTIGVEDIYFIDGGQLSAAKKE